MKPTPFPTVNGSDFSWRTKLKPAKLKDLRVHAGRTEANVTALRLAIDSYEPEQPDLKARVMHLQTLMAELRGEVEDLAR